MLHINIFGTQNTMFNKLMKIDKFLTNKKKLYINEIDKLIKFEYHNFNSTIKINLIQINIFNIKPII